MFRFFKRKPQTATPPASNVPDEKGTLVAAEVSVNANAEVLHATTNDSWVNESIEPVVALTQLGDSSPQTDVGSTAIDAVPTTPDLMLATPIELTAEKKENTSWMARLTKSMSRTGKQIGVLFGHSTIDEALYEDLEAALIMADAGPQASQQLIKTLRQRVRSELIDTPAGAKQALCDVLTDHLKVLEKPFDVGVVKPLVVMIAGVNGAGKTTSIGKLAHTLQAQGAKVLLAAGDTFRAAAREQLIEWGARNNVSVIAQEGGDPAAVAFDAVHAGKARQVDVVMVDTAGRLPTQLHLMDELKKIKRVVSKADNTAPHEILLVIDGNTGQNALMQVKAFDAALGLTGLIVTKLDGTAKGGVLCALAAGAQGSRPIPVYWVGIGEQINDLQPFVAREFAKALVN
jgi:fused signal recognition particle receptor